jgi:hypothetical protein
LIGLTQRKIARRIEKGVVEEHDEHHGEDEEEHEPLFKIEALM